MLRWFKRKHVHKYEDWSIPLVTAHVQSTGGGIITMFCLDCREPKVLVIPPL